MAEKPPEKTLESSILESPKFSFQVQETTIAERIKNTMDTMKGDT